MSFVASHNTQRVYARRTMFLSYAQKIPLGATTLAKKRIKLQGKIYEVCGQSPTHAKGLCKTHYKLRSGALSAKLRNKRKSIDVLSAKKPSWLIHRANNRLTQVNKTFLPWAEQIKWLKIGLATIIIF